MRNIQRYLVTTYSGRLQYWAPTNYQEALKITNANQQAVLIDLATSTVLSGILPTGSPITTPIVAPYPLYQFMVLVNQASLAEELPSLDFWYSSFPDFTSAQERSDATVAMGQGYSAVVFDIVAGTTTYQSTSPSTPAQLNRVRLGSGVLDVAGVSAPVAWGAAWEAAAPGLPFRMGVIGY